MMAKLVTLLLLLAVHNVSSTAVSNFIDVNKYSASYYDLSTGLGLRGELEDSGREPLSAVKIAFRGLPCQCESLTCGCCAGVNLTALNFDRRACTNFTFEPYDFAIRMAISMNERVVYSNALSAKNPPPFCVPFAYFPAINFCVRFFDLHTSGRNLHACIDFETRIINQPILILHFNCVRLGADGVAWLKPEDAVTADVKPEALSQSTEVYDDVDFEPHTESLSTPSDGTTLTPEQEDQIGQLKL